MTEEEAKKAVKEDIEAIAKASDDQEDKLKAMLVKLKPDKDSSNGIWTDTPF